MWQREIPEFYEKCRESQLERAIREKPRVDDHHEIMGDRGFRTERPDHSRGTSFNRQYGIEKDFDNLKCQEVSQDYRLRQVVLFHQRILLLRAKVSNIMFIHVQL